MTAPWHAPPLQNVPVSDNADDLELKTRFVGGVSLQQSIDDVPPPTRGVPVERWKTSYHPNGQVGMEAIEPPHASTVSIANHPRYPAFIFLIFLTLLSVKIILAIALDTITLDNALKQRAQMQEVTEMWNKQTHVYFDNNDFEADSGTRTPPPGPSDDDRFSTQYLPKWSRKQLHSVPSPEARRAIARLAARK